MISLFTRINTTTVHNSVHKFTDTLKGWDGNLAAPQGCFSRLMDSATWHH